ncbi:MAG TPA: ParA family protein [Gammaproteobacteria bacterium]|nr:ParA family protein [Gammaproteobacteria bacterium]
MRVWSVANQKGGVGKTTTAVTLAGLCALQGERTLLIDLDPHGSVTAYFGYDPESIEHSVYELFQFKTLQLPQIKSLISETCTENLHILPASTALATLDRQLGNRDGMGLTVARTLALLNEEYQQVFIDCPPMLGVLMINALAACQQLVIPVQTEFLATKGLERMMRTLKMIERSRQTPLPYTIIPTMFDRRTRASWDTLKVLQQQFAQYLWSSYVPIDTNFREASRAGKPLCHFMPSSRGVQAYRELLVDLRGEGEAGKVAAI